MKSILFADDDRRVLSSLRRQLVDHRIEWEMTFVPGGAEALALLPLVPFDAVVSDLRMPEVDGAMVLAEAARNQPRAARLVLSGYADPSRRRLAANCAHRFLDKPCPAETLSREVKQALEVRSIIDRLADESLQRLWSRPPGIQENCTTVLFALDHESSADDGIDHAAGIAAMLQEETALWGRVSSALAVADPGRAGSVRSPAELVAAVGLTTVVCTILASRFVATVAGHESHSWSEAVSRAAELVAGDLTAPSAVELLVAGLLAGVVTVDPDPERLAVLAYLLPSWGFHETVIEWLTGASAAIDSRIRRLTRT